MLFHVRFHQLYFNPHSPCGERLTTGIDYYVTDLFQSTLPMRGATIWVSADKHPVNDFNPHSPCGERPAVTGKIHSFVVDFNPHSPCGERRFRQLHGVWLWGFQSTLPMRGATWSLL